MRSTQYLLAALSLAACSTSSYEPLIDTKGADMSNYRSDLVECRKYAETVSPVKEAGTGAVVGGAVSAALGAAVGAIFGSPGRGAAAGAVLGGGGGAVRGAAKGSEERARIVRRCLSGRGYRVLK